MYDIEYTNTFKKDLKLLQKRSVAMEPLRIIIEILISGETIPAKYRNHKLKGNLSNKYDLHVYPDVVLLYTKDVKSKIIKLVRIGSHSDLF